MRLSMYSGVALAVVAAGTASKARADDQEQHLTSLMQTESTEDASTD